MTSFNKLFGENFIFDEIIPLNGACETRSNAFAECEEAASVFHHDFNL